MEKIRANVFPLILRIVRIYLCIIMYLKLYLLIFIQKINDIFN